MGMSLGFTNSTSITSIGLHIKARRGLVSDLEARSGAGEPEVERRSQKWSRGVRSGVGDIYFREVADVKML